MKYTELFDELRRSIVGTALDREHNPVLLVLDRLTSLDLKIIIHDYSCLSNRAIHFLTSAMIYSHRWEYLYREIESNIEEEKGKLTKGIPHLIMMRDGYLKDLGINTSRATPLLSTKKFVYNMSDIFIDNNPAYVAGAVLAFESVAIEEFHILEAIVMAYLNTKHRDRLEGLTKEYIVGHKLFEVEHSKGMENAIDKHLTDDAVIHLREGYEAVRHEMDLWWRSLAEEVRRNK